MRSGKDRRARGDEKRTLALRSFMKRRRRAAPERIVTGTRTIANSANAVANVNYYRENRAGLASFVHGPSRSPASFSILYLIEIMYRVACYANAPNEPSGLINNLQNNIAYLRDSVEFLLFYGSLKNIKDLQRNVSTNVSTYNKKILKKYLFYLRTIV